MSSLAPVQEAITDTQKAIFSEITAAFGMVPNLFRVYAHHDSVLESNWGRVKTVMMGGTLPRKLKEAIAVVVSSDNGCHYCVAHHSMALKSMGVSEADIEALITVEQSGNWSEKEQSLINFARQANRDPKSADRVLLNGSNHDTKPGELVEAMAVMELFSSFNKFIDTFKVQLEQ